MSTYEPRPFVEPVGYQPVEFLDIPQLSEARGGARADDASERTGARLNGRTRARLTGWARHYIAALVESHHGDREDVQAIIDDLALDQHRGRE